MISAQQNYRSHNIITEGAHFTLAQVAEITTWALDYLACGDLCTPCSVCQLHAEAILEDAERTELADAAQVTYSNRTDAIQRQIIDAILAGDVTDIAEYDVDTIADRVLGDYTTGYALRVGTEAFWAIVAECAVTQAPVRAPRVSRPAWWIASREVARARAAERRAEALAAWHRANR
jgi:hypothetical protein